MKKIWLALPLVLLMADAMAQTLFTYGPYAVSKEEFLRAYNKNKTPVADREQSLREYVDLYSRFKLKVLVAEQMRLDTLQKLKYDYENFRSQVADAYMNDDKALDVLVDEAITRGKKDIHVMHFYVPLDSTTVADTAKAYRALNELARAVNGNGSDYRAAVASVSQKYLPVITEDLGFITVLSVPYAIENLVYGLKPGQTSKPYRSGSALHLFKNLEERAGAGRWRVAQILLSIPPEATAGDIDAIAKRADSIYRVLTAGADFSELAKQVSEDKLTYLNGGEMSEFGTGKYEPVFEKQVFALKQDGEISRPFKTAYGYHIVKRLQHRDLPTDRSDDVFVSELKQQILQDTRVNASQAAFLKTVKQRTGFRRNQAVGDTALFRYADSIASGGTAPPSEISDRVVFSFARQQVKVSDWLNFIRDYRLNPDVYKGETNAALFEKFTATSAMEYYRKNLESFNPDFKNQMEEFRQGNMLFEIMDRNVWTKAANDTAGLHAFYDAHRNDYTWSSSANVVLFNCNDSSAAVAAAQALKKGEEWRNIAELSSGKCQADSGRFELSQLQLPNASALTEGVVTSVYRNGDHVYSVVELLRMFPDKELRSFDDAKGLVINDYQTFLENKWVEGLKTSYPVKVNEAVFRSLVR